MNDTLVRAMSCDGWIKATAISSRGIVERARGIQHSSPIATAALGRLLTAASMIGNMQKIDDGSVTLQIKGGGPLGTLLAVSDAAGNVRGYVQRPAVPTIEKHPGKLDVGAAVGCDGQLTVIRDLQMKEPYVGSIPLVSGEIAEDITAYFVQSEQVPTACALGVLVDTDQSVRAAGGYLIQILPGCPDEVIDQIEAGIARAGAVTQMLDRAMTPAQILQTVLEGVGLELLETVPVEYRCYCSRERVERALISLGAGELRQMAEDGQTERVECQFCDKVYEFDPAQLRALADEAVGRPTEEANH